MTPAQAEAFWFFPEAEDPPPGPATDAMIAAFEADHGIILPPSFILLYQCQNGGFSRTHYDSFWSIGAAVTPLTTLDRLCDGYHDDNLVAA